MIEEQFVSFETAKMLKEAGFNEPCCYNYDNVNRFRWFKIGESTPKGWVPCPTQALVAKWLRDVHHLNVYACFDDGERKWFFMRENTMINDYTSVYCSIISYDSYEQALEAGLQESLKLIKK